MHTPKHASNSSNRAAFAYWAKVTSLAAVFFFLAAFFIGAVPQLRANAAVRVNWTHQTCRAFYSWDAHRTGGRLNTLMSNSEHVPWKYLGADVAGLYRDVRAGKTKSIPDAATWVNQDCGG